jgi:hypothetical protein
VQGYQPTEDGFAAILGNGYLLYLVPEIDSMFGRLCWRWAIREGYRLGGRAERVEPLTYGVRLSLREAQAAALAWVDERQTG